MSLGPANAARSTIGSGRAVSLAGSSRRSASGSDARSDAQGSRTRAATVASGTSRAGSIGVAAGAAGSVAGSQAGRSSSRRSVGSGVLGSSAGSQGAAEAFGTLGASTETGRALGLGSAAVASAGNVIGGTTSTLERAFVPPPARLFGPAVAGRIRDPQLEEVCQLWETFAQEVARAIALGEPLPSPPGQPKGMPREVGRVTEAALSALAALWPSESEAKYLRRQFAELQLASTGAAPKTMDSADPEMTGALWKEKEETLRLMKRDVMLTERVAATRAELFRMREKDSEQAEAIIDTKCQLLEARERAARALETNKERDWMLVKLRRQAEEFTRRLQQHSDEYELTKRALQESEARCQRLRRELYDSERERKRVMDTVRRVLGKMDANLLQEVTGDNFGLSSSRSQPHLVGSGISSSPSPAASSPASARSTPRGPAQPTSLAPTRSTSFAPARAASAGPSKLASPPPSRSATPPPSRSSSPARGILKAVSAVNSMQPRTGSTPQRGGAAPRGREGCGTPPGRNRGGTPRECATAAASRSHGASNPSVAGRGLAGAFAAVRAFSRAHSPGRTASPPRPNAERSVTPPGGRSASARFGPSASEPWRPSGKAAPKAPVFNFPRDAGVSGIVPNMQRIR